MSYLLWFILIAIALFFIAKFMKQFKVAKIGSLCLVNGGVKCGKSTLSVSIVRSEYKSRVRKTKFMNLLKAFLKGRLQPMARLQNI